MEAVEGLFEPNQKRPDKLEDFEFTFIDLKPIRKESQPGFIIEWGVKKVGFGQLTFYTRNGELKVDSEAMGKEFSIIAFKKLIDKLDKAGNFE